MPISSRLSMTRRRRVLAVLALSVLAACGNDIVGVDGTPRAIFVPVGEELDVTLGDVGPGTFASPPQMSTTALRFLDVSTVSPGTNQRFRFVAVQTGQTLVQFRRVLGDSVISVVEDTVIVHAG
jgi:hypothetical protein